MSGFDLEALVRSVETRARDTRSGRLPVYEEEFNAIVSRLRAAENVIENVRTVLPHMPDTADPDAYTERYGNGTLVMPWRITLGAAMAIDSLIDAMQQLDVAAPRTKEG